MSLCLFVSLVPAVSISLLKCAKGKKGVVSERGQHKGKEPKTIGSSRTPSPNSANPKPPAPVQADQPATCKSNESKNSPTTTNSPTTAPPVPITKEKTEGSPMTAENNFLDCLPKEMLVHVASFLPPKDFNSLVRTNKTTRSRLRNRDRQPLHIVVELFYEYDEKENNLTLFSSGVYLTTTNGRKCFRFSIEEPTLSKQEQEPMSAIADWYYNESMRAEPRRHVFSGNIKNMISVHLEFLKFHNIIIKSLCLCDAEETELVDLLTFLKLNRMRVNSLSLCTDIIKDYHMDLIHICCPNSLMIIDAHVVPSTFHLDHVVRQIDDLSVESQLVEMKRGELAAYYSERSVTMRHIRGATVQDIELFVKQWTNSRVLGDKSLDLLIDNHESVVHNLLAQLDRRLVEVNTELNYTYQGRFRLKRVSDSITSSVGWGFDPDAGFFVSFSADA